jgi:ABC-type nitrate/sulfonate/bicarbonate transport system permease component
MTTDTIQHSESAFATNRSARMQGWYFGIAVVSAWLILWEITIRSWPIGGKFFLPPSACLRLFFRSLLLTGELWPHLRATVQRLVIGMSMGAVPAMWLGRAIGRSNLLRRRWGALMMALGLIPVFSLLPMFTILFGIMEINKWAVVSWAVFLPIFYTTSLAARGRSPIFRKCTESPRSGDL